MDTQSQSQGQASSPNASQSNASTDRPSPAEAESIIRRAAEVARQNAERQAAEDPQRLATGDLGERIKKVGESIRAGDLSAHDRRVAEMLEAEKRRERLMRIDRLVAANGVPSKYHAAMPDELLAVPEEDREAYAAKLRRLQELVLGPVIVGLVGPRGPGKTWMACAVVNSLCLHGIAAEYHEVTDYFLALKSTYGDGAVQEQAYVENRWLAPKLLVLDEMQERGDTPWEDRMLTRLVNKRYASERPTVLVSNQDPTSFADRVGSSISDRINDGGALIECPWDSLRGRIGGVA